MAELNKLVLVKPATLEHTVLELLPRLKGNKVFRKHPSEKVHGQSILKVVTHFFTVHALDPIEDIARDFEAFPKVLALGVLDDKDRLIGLIDRSQFFNELGQPFGRDVLVKKPALAIAEEITNFYFNKSIFSVAIELDSKDLVQDKVYFFGLTDAQGRFAGLFSSMDLLRYLSNVTQQDISLAGQLQERLVKEKQAVEEKNFSFYGFSQYAKGMGGDFYGMYPIGDDRWFFTICDVSGKGVAASVITSMLWGMFRLYDWRKGLKHLIQEVNKALIQTFHLEKYVTGVFGFYDASSRKIKLADMGHSMAYIVRDGKITHINGPHINLPIGLELDLDPNMISIKLQQSDSLFFMTDGLVEQENAQGQTLEAKQWIKRLLPLVEKDADPRDAMLSLFNEFRKGIPQQDDITAMVMQIR